MKYLITFLFLIVYALANYFIVVEVHKYAYKGIHIFETNSSTHCMGILNNKALYDDMSQYGQVKEISCYRENSLEDIKLKE